MDLDELDKLIQSYPETVKMLLWAKRWLESAPLMGSDTKQKLLNFCNEWGVKVNLPK